MMRIKEKILYCLSLVFFLLCGVVFGYVKTMSNSHTAFNPNILDYALRYSDFAKEQYVVPASTMVSDIEVIYEDCYLTCNEVDTSTKMVYGSTMDKVKEEERKSQEEKGLIYAIKSEGNTRIIYTRNINGNCPNHYMVKSENNIITIYRIKGENKKEVYMKLEDVNISNLREQLKVKVEKGAYINSREELNKFIEDLQT